MIPTLESPDDMYVEAAMGWCELGAFDEATSELKSVRPDLLNNPLVLEAQWHICAGLKKRKEALRIAEMLVESFPNWPNGWLYKARSLAQMGRDVEALDTALLGNFRFSSDEHALYGAASGCCALGKLDEAESLLERAIEVGGEVVRLVALKDRDFKPLWAILRKG